MEVYRPKYKDRKGKVKKCSCWYLTFNGRAGVRRRMQAYTNKDESDNLGRDIDKVMANNGKLKDDNAKSWFANLLPRIQGKLIEYHIVDERTTANHLGTLLTEHLKVFCESLAADKRGQGHIEQTRTTIERILNECGFRVFSDIDGVKVKTCLARGRGEDGFGERTFNAYLRAFKTFCKWLRDKRKLSPDPMNDHKLIKQTEYRKKRRALSLAEMNRLYAAAENGITHSNLTGQERHLVYQLALETGARFSEIAQMKKLSFDFEARPATVRVEAADAKGKEADNLILFDETAAMLQKYLEDKEPQDQAFKMPHKANGAVMIRRDLKVAGIAYRNEAGEDVDFHSLRHTFITNLVLAGVTPAVCQRLARHSNLEITNKYYTHLTQKPLAEGIDKLRDLTLSCPNDAQTGTPVDFRGRKNLDNDAKTALSA